MSKRHIVVIDTDDDMRHPCSGRFSFPPGCMMLKIMWLHGAENWHATESADVRANIERLRVWQSALELVTGRDPFACPRCGGRLEQEPLLTDARAPPELDRAV